MDKADSWPLGTPNRAWGPGSDPPRQVSEPEPAAQDGAKKDDLEEADRAVPTPASALPLDAGLKAPAPIEESSEAFEARLPEMRGRPYPKVRRAMSFEDPDDEAALAAAALHAGAIPVPPLPVFGPNPRTNPRVRALKGPEGAKNGENEAAETVLAGFRQKVALLLRVMAFGAALVMAVRVALRELKALRHEKPTPTGRDGVDGRGRRFRLWLR